MSESKPSCIDCGTTDDIVEVHLSEHLMLSHEQAIDTIKKFTRCKDCKKRRANAFIKYIKQKEQSDEK